jgi:hypothetical protein
MFTMLYNNFFKLKITGLGKDVEKAEPQYISGKCKMGNILALGKFSHVSKS